MQIPIHQTTTTAFYTLISAVGRRMQNFSKAEAARVSFSVSITEINALVIHPAFSIWPFWPLERIIIVD